MKTLHRTVFLLLLFVTAHLSTTIVCGTLGREFMRWSLSGMWFPNYRLDVTMPTAFAYLLAAAYIPPNIGLPLTEFFEGGRLPYWPAPPYLKYFIVNSLVWGTVGLAIVEWTKRFIGARVNIAIRIATFAFLWFSLVAWTTAAYVGGADTVEAIYKQIRDAPFILEIIVLPYLWAVLRGWGFIFHLLYSALAGTLIVVIVAYCNKLQWTRWRRNSNDNDAIVTEPEA